MACKIMQRVNNIPNYVKENVLHWQRDNISYLLQMIYKTKSLPEKNADRVVYEKELALARIEYAKTMKTYNGVAMEEYFKRNKQ